MAEEREEDVEAVMAERPGRKTRGVRKEWRPSVLR
jgi:hypothetical protein